MQMSSRGGRAHKDYVQSMEDNQKRLSGDWERRDNRSSRMTNAKMKYCTSLNMGESQPRDRHIGLYSPDCTVTYTPLSRSPPHNPSQIDFESGMVGRQDSMDKRFTKEKMPERDVTQHSSNRNLDARSLSPIFPNVEDREVFEINQGQSTRYQEDDDYHGPLFRPLEWEDTDRSASPTPRQQYRGSPPNRSELLYSPQRFSWEDRRERGNRRENPEINRSNKRDLMEKGNRERGWHEKQDYCREEWPVGKDGSGDRWAGRLFPPRGDHSNDPWLVRRDVESSKDNWRETADRNIPKDDRTKGRDVSKHCGRKRKYIDNAECDRNKRKDSENTNYERNRRKDSHDTKYGWAERRGSDISKDKWLQTRDHVMSQDTVLEKIDRGSSKDSLLERRDVGSSMDVLLERRGHNRYKDNWVEKRDLGSSKDNWVEKRDLGSSKDNWVEERDCGSSKDNLLESRDLDISKDNWLEKRDLGSCKDNMLERRDHDSSIDNLIERRGHNRSKDSWLEQRDHERLKDDCWVGRRDWDSSIDRVDRRNFDISKNDWSERRNEDSMKDNWFERREFNSPKDDWCERRKFAGNSRSEASHTWKGEWPTRVDNMRETFDVFDQLERRGSPKDGFRVETSPLTTDWAGRFDKPREKFPLTTRTSHLFDNDRELWNEKMQTKVDPPPAEVIDYNNLPLLPPPPPPPILSFTPPILRNTTDYSKPLPFKPPLVCDVENVQQSVQLLEKLKKKQEILSKCQLKIGELYRSRTKLSNEPSSFIPSVQRLIQLNCNESPVVFTHQALSFNCIKINKFELEDSEFKANLKGNDCSDSYGSMGMDRKNAFNTFQRSLEDFRSPNILDQFGSVDYPVSTDKERSPCTFSSADMLFQKPSPPVRPLSPDYRTTLPITNPNVDMACRTLQEPSAPAHLSSREIQEFQPTQPNLDSDYSHQLHSRGSGWPIYKAPTEVAPHTTSHSVRVPPPPPVITTPTIEPALNQSRDYQRPNRSLITLNLLPRDNAFQGAYCPDSSASLNASVNSSSQADSAYASKVEEFLAKIQGDSRKPEKRPKSVKDYSVVLSDDDDVIYVGESKKSPSRNRSSLSSSRSSGKNDNGNRKESLSEQPSRQERKRKFPESRSASRKSERNDDGHRALSISEQPSRHEKKRQNPELHLSGQRCGKHDDGNRKESIYEQPLRHEIKKQFPELPSSGQKSKKNNGGNRKDSISEQSSKHEVKRLVMVLPSSSRGADKIEDGITKEIISEQPSRHEMKRQFSELSDEPPGTSPLIHLPPSSVTSPKRSHLEEAQTGEITPVERLQAPQILPKLSAAQSSNLTLIVGKSNSRAEKKRIKKLSLKTPSKPNLIVVESSFFKSDKIGDKKRTNNCPPSDIRNPSIPRVNKTCKNVNISPSSGQSIFHHGNKESKIKKGQEDPPISSMSRDEKQEDIKSATPKKSSSVKTKVVIDSAHVCNLPEEKNTLGRVLSNSEAVSGLSEEKNPPRCSSSNLAAAQESSEEKNPPSCSTSNLAAAQESSEEKTSPSCATSNVGAAEGSSEEKKPPSCAVTIPAVVPRSSEDENPSCKQAGGTTTASQVNKTYWNDGFKLSDFENIFNEVNEISITIRNIQTNDERLQKVFNNTLRNKTINKSLCIQNGMLCLKNEALGIRIVASTIEEKIIYYLHCLFRHRNDCLTTVLKKYFTPIKELGEKMKSALKSCESCLKKPVGSSKDARQCSKEVVSKKNTTSVVETSIEHSLDPTTALQESAPVSKDLSDKTIKDPMSLVKEIQSSSEHINDIISKLDQDENKSLYFLKNNLLLKRCQVGNKTLLKILIPEDKIKEVIVVAHEVFSVHGDMNGVMSILEKLFSPMPGLEDHIEKAIAACSHCSNTKSN